MTRIICDFETASACDLLLCGAAVYSEHPTTEILCLVWKREHRLTHGVWTPLLPEYANLDETRALAEDPANIFVSHSSFEQFIWKNIMVPLGLPELPPERWEDTQATAAWYSLPLAVDPLCRRLELPVQKDMEGRTLTLSLSESMTKAAWERQAPGGWADGMAAWRRRFQPGTMDRSRATIERVIEYCKTDVDAEEAVLRRLGDLSSAERKVWLLDQDINHRGVRLDMTLIRAMQSIVDQETTRLEAEVLEMTGGVSATQVQKLTAWCAGQGVALENMQKDYIDGLLGVEDEDNGYDSLAGEEVEDGAAVVQLPDVVRRVLVIRQMLGSASIKKLTRMQHCVGGDGRARGLLQYHAAHPGRWGGRLLQPHNFPRGSLRLDADTAVAAIHTCDPRQLEYAVRLHAWQKAKSGKPDDLDYYAKVTAMGAIQMVSSCLRYTLIAAERHTFEAGDYAGIEMRVDLALAGQHDKCDLLATGFDVYLDMAEDIYNRPKGSWAVTDKAELERVKHEFLAERTIGKNTVLGCGFQMGALKFHARYCPEQPLSFAKEVVQVFRTQWAPKVPVMWRTFHEAVNICVGRGSTVRVYGCTFRRQGDFMAIDLPSGWQTIWYYQPAMRLRIDPQTKQESLQPSYWAMKSGKWLLVWLYGGIICENIVQALARGILVGAMGRLTAAGHPLVLTVHDEVIAEVPLAVADKGQFKAIMLHRSKWIDDIGVPLDVDAWVGPRYKK